MFAKVVEHFTELQRPIVTILAENEGLDYELEMENGYFKLPNGDFYPHNLFDAIQSLTSHSGDVMGEAIIRAAFNDITKFTLEPKRVVKLLPDRVESVKNAQMVIDRIQFQISASPIMQNLEQSWKNMSFSIRDNHPGTLLCVQRVFERKKIYTMENLPQTEKDIVSLMKEIPANDVIPQLLEQAMGIKVPKLNISPVTGQCYNIINDCTVPITIFKLETNYTLSPIGYLIPSDIKCELNPEIKDICEFVSSNAEYIESRLKDLNVVGNINAHDHVFHVSARVGGGYNVISTNVECNKFTKFTALREYRQFRLTLVNDVDLSTEFTAAVDNLPNFALEELESVKKFNAFFQRFGTHVVTSCFGGGAIEITASVETTKTFKSIEDMRGFASQLRAVFGNVFGLGIDSSYTGGYQRESRTNLSNISYTIALKGGDMAYHIRNLAQLSSDKASEHIQKWVQSLSVQPLMLNTNMHLVPLSYYVRKYNPNAAQEIDLASQELFKANLKYVSSLNPPPPPPRPDVPPPLQQKSSGCLKSGTFILLSDGRNLPVERIQAGDMVLDINLKPSRVVGVNHMFLDGKQFYGFSENNCFFTGGHIFARNKSNEFFVLSKHELLKDNPFLDDLNITEVQRDQSMEVMKINGNFGTTAVVCETVTIYRDETQYDATVPVYFLIVENETGTYIANGYVCRHSLPRFERWPKTLACLQKIFTSDVLKRNFTGKKLSIMALREMEKMADHVAEQLKKALSSNRFIFVHETTNAKQESILEESTMTQLSRYLTTMTEIAHDNYWSAFAMLIYGRCGGLFRDVLDNQKNETVSCSLLTDFVIKRVESFAKNN
ncbi:unnamed protein product [Rotaria sp. Silwood1]|nr:unnamed protein product [Rotaria sp. Silwood1]